MQILPYGPILLRFLVFCGIKILICCTTKFSQMIWQHCDALGLCVRPKAFVHYSVKAPQLPYTAWLSVYGIAPHHIRRGLPYTKCTEYTASKPDWVCMRSYFNYSKAVSLIME